MWLALKPVRQCRVYAPESSQLAQGLVEGVCFALAYLQAQSKELVVNV